jgi:hypothetical protein
MGGMGGKFVKVGRSIFARFAFLSVLAAAAAMADWLFCVTSANYLPVKLENLP